MHCEAAESEIEASILRSRRRLRHASFLMRAFCIQPNTKHIGTAASCPMPQKPRFTENV